MAEPSNVRTRTLDNPLALRAFAHPLRQRLYGLIAREGTLTSADAARMLDISHALASHHVRQLAKYGFVEPAEASDARAHPWRITSTSYRIEPSTPDGRAPADLLERGVLERASSELAEWQATRETQDPRVAAAAGVSESLLYLTPDELTEVVAAWRAIIGPLADRRPLGHHDRRPEGALPIDFTLAVVPLAPTERGG